LPSCFTRTVAPITISPRVSFTTPKIFPCWAFALNKLPSASISIAATLIRGLWNFFMGSSYLFLSERTDQRSSYLRRIKSRRKPVYYIIFEMVTHFQEPFKLFLAQKT
jgi:hypothetical protein